MSISKDHGDPTLSCRATRWTDYLQFFLLNYVAHSATLKTLPGQSAANTVIDILVALFFPTAGVFRGFKAIKGSAILAHTDLQVAARAEALCTVVPWPSTVIELGSNSQAAKRVPRPIWSLFETKIHGKCRLPPGFVLALVPPDAEFESDLEDSQNRSMWKSLAAAFHPSRSRPVRVACSYNIIKILIAIIQLLYAVTTMYQTRGEQIEWYGYTAFGLTVAPYAWMSLVNLWANLMCPEFSAIYLVGSPATTKLQRRANGRVELDGMVGHMTEASYDALISKLEVSMQESAHPRQSRSKRLSKQVQNWFQIVYLTVLAAAVPLIIIGTLSHFQTGSSNTQLMQISVTLWYLYGVYFGFMGPLLSQAFEDRPFVNVWARGFRAVMARLLAVITLLVGGGIAGWGLYWAGIMLQEYGVCIKTD